MRIDLKALAYEIASALNLDYEVDLGDFGIQTLPIDIEDDVEEQILNILRDELGAYVYTDIIYAYNEEKE